MTSTRAPAMGEGRAQSWRPWRSRPGGHGERSMAAGELGPGVHGELSVDADAPMSLAPAAMASLMLVAMGSSASTQAAPERLSLTQTAPARSAPVAKERASLVLAAMASDADCPGELGPAAMASLAAMAMGSSPRPWRARLRRRLPQRARPRRPGTEPAVGQPGLEPPYRWRVHGAP
jgi:hypothetical protein